jgi:hypothetical protein
MLKGENPKVDIIEKRWVGLVEHGRVWDRNYVYSLHSYGNLCY